MHIAVIFAFQRQLLGDQSALHHIHRLFVAGNQRRLLRIGGAATGNAIIDRLVLVGHDAATRIFRHDLHRIVISGNDDRRAIRAGAGRTAGNQRVNAAADKHQTDGGRHRHDPAATAAFVFIAISRLMIDIGILGIARGVATGSRSLLHGAAEILFQRPFELVGFFRGLCRARLRGTTVFGMLVTVEATGNSRCKQRRKLGIDIKVFLVTANLRLGFENPDRQFRNIHLDDVFRVLFRLADLRGIERQAFQRLRCSRLRRGRCRTRLNRSDRCGDGYGRRARLRCGLFPHRLGRGNSNGRGGLLANRLRRGCGRNLGFGDLRKVEIKIEIVERQFEIIIVKAGEIRKIRFRSRR
ncbi:hypothetical protein D3C80_865320 [compost metagenome]